MGEATYGQERQRQEQDGHNGQLLHTFILASAMGVEDEINHVICCSAHLIKSFSHENAMIFHVTKVYLGHRMYGDRGGA